jgi:polar amino acid transport system substrate-binding protein
VIGRHLLLCLSAAAAVAQTPLPQRYRDAGVLRWGADKEGGEPFVYDDPARAGAEIGFEVELAQELGRMLGVRTEHVQTAFESLVQGLERGDFDFVLNGFEPLPARRAEVRFTRPYYVFQQQLTVAKTTTGVTSLADLAGKRVGVLGNTSSWQVARDAPGVEVVVYESNVLAYQKVVDGTDAASLADLPIAQALRPKFPQLTDAGPPFGEFHYAMAVRRDEPELQRALDGAIAALLKDGSLERIYRKWHL